MDAIRGFLFVDALPPPPRSSSFVVHEGRPSSLELELEELDELEPGEPEPGRLLFFRLFLRCFFRRFFLAFFRRRRALASSRSTAAIANRPGNASGSGELDRPGNASGAAAEYFL